jgi:hypothetical protein
VAVNNPSEVPGHLAELQARVFADYTRSGLRLGNIYLKSGGGLVFLPRDLLLRASAARDAKDEAGDCP